MKPMKQCAALLLALVMVFSMTLTVSAAENGTITINGVTPGKVYELYRIFNLTMASDTAVAYTINENWEAFFAEDGAGAGYIVDANVGDLNPITVKGEGKYINITEGNVKAFSAAAQVYAAKLTAADAVQTASENPLVFTGLPLGYYLVYPQGATDILEGNGCICSLTSTVTDAEVNVKATYPSITKTDNTVSADLGQEIPYTITGKVPDTAGFTSYEYTVRDTMTEGLTLQENVEVTFGGEKIEAEVTYAENGFTVTFDMTKYQTYKGEEIVITYSAVVNANAVVQDRVEKNKATLTYSHDPKDSTKTTTTPEIEEEVYSSQIVIDKVDGKNQSTKLEGAEFVLKNDQKKYYNLTDGKVTWVAEESATKVITDETGAASFDGLKNGTYYLVEIKAPDGYNLLTDPVPVAVNKDGQSTVSVSVVAEVANNSGTTLPETGGMGTTLIYTLGGILVLAAAVLLITKKRMGAM